MLLKHEMIDPNSNNILIDDKSSPLNLCLEKIIWSYLTFVTTPSNRSEHVMLSYITPLETMQM